MNKNNTLKSARKKVEAVLEKYQIYLLTFPDEMQPKITASYSIVPSSKTNEYYSATEDTALNRIEYQREREEFLQCVISAVNRCNQTERAILYKRYLEAEDVFDYEVYNDIGISERKYYRMKGQAFDKLALMFGFISLADLKGD